MKRQFACLALVLAVFTSFADGQSCLANEKNASENFEQVMMYKTKTPLAHQHTALAQLDDASRSDVSRIRTVIFHEFFPSNTFKNRLSALYRLDLERNGQILSVKKFRSFGGTIDDEAADIAIKRARYPKSLHFAQAINHKVFWVYIDPRGVPNDLAGKRLEHNQVEVVEDAPNAALLSKLKPREIKL